MPSTKHATRQPGIDEPERKKRLTPVLGKALEEKARPPPQRCPAVPASADKGLARLTDTLGIGALQVGEHSVCI
jgi:hypothetical protein